MIPKNAAGVALMGKDRRRILRTSFNKTKEAGRSRDRLAFVEATALAQRRLITVHKHNGDIIHAILTHASQVLLPDS